MSVAAAASCPILRGATPARRHGLAGGRGGGRGAVTLRVNNATAAAWGRGRRVETPTRTVAAAAATPGDGGDVVAKTEAAHEEDDDKRKNPSLYVESLAAAAAVNDATPTPSTDAPAAATATAAVVAKQEGPRLKKPVLRKPEILAPAGGWPQMRAAVEAGADAVYFALSALNARARAANFDVEELPTVMAYLHERGVRGFVTMNVLVFDEELAQAEGLVIVGAVQL
jgi:hypothetical protein